MNVKQNINMLQMWNNNSKCMWSNAIIWHKCENTIVDECEKEAYISSSLSSSSLSSALSSLSFLLLQLSLLLLLLSLSLILR